MTRKERLVFGKRNDEGEYHAVHATTGVFYRVMRHHVMTPSRWAWAAHPMNPGTGGVDWAATGLYADTLEALAGKLGYGEVG